MKQRIWQCGVRGDSALALALVSALVAANVSAFAQILLPAPVPVAREQDGISASLAFENNEAVVRWRFLKPLQTPLTEVAATINDRPLGVPNLDPYTETGEATFIILLLDVTDPRREAQIVRDKVTLFQIVGRAAPRHDMAIMLYGEQPQLLVPDAGNLGMLVNMVAAAPPRMTSVNLGSALRAAMELISRAPAARRGIFVLSDGHDDGAFDTAALADQARRSGIAINFILSRSERTADVEALAKVAQAAGGLVVGESQRAEFMKSPFELLESGGRVRYPLANVSRLFWESEAEVKVVFRYADNRLELSSEAPIPVAGVGGTAAYILQNNTTAISGVAIVALGGFAFVMLRKRRAVARQEVAAVAEENKVSVKLAAAPVKPQQRTLAVLQDIESGSSHPVNTPHVRIGRNQDNDIVLSDPSVGRFHAVLQQVGDRVFSIVDQSSANGTLVNNKRIDTATLAEGDLISLGSKVLRFHKISKSGTMAGE